MIKKVLFYTLIVSCLLSCKGYKDFAFTIHKEQFSSTNDQAIPISLDTPIQLVLSDQGENSKVFLQVLQLKQRTLFDNKAISNLTPSLPFISIDSINYQYPISSDKYPSMIQFTMSNQRALPQEKINAQLKKSPISFYGARLSYTIFDGKGMAIQQGNLVASPAKSNQIAFEVSDRDDHKHVSKEHYTLYTNSKTIANYYRKKGHFITEIENPGVYTNTIKYLENYRYIVYPKNEEGSLIGNPFPFFLKKSNAANALVELLEQEFQKDE